MPNEQSTFLRDVERDGSKIASAAGPKRWQVGDNDSLDRNGGEVNQAGMCGLDAQGSAGNGF